ncbi:hypothetical protein [Alteribacillus bidgolensis]|uniref:Sporulation lipoprotein YhcN/YlaJ (Spore_YhcN_YlaJ) n=1 Tax=Alteribacillus bidgolensis TaxID=930129 RepID=A0A1G8M1K3_9BACI|nr:hypothetical protein [Alteribacillus bidgolensis]SDI61765.1 hypothetical protein SAMN05216352_109172 [Alteribacillus bidgolensis]
MKQTTLAVMVGMLLCTSACQNDLSPDAQKEQAAGQHAPWVDSLTGPGPANSSVLRPAQDGSSPSDYNQGPGNVSMTTKKQTQGSDKDMVEHIAQKHGFSPIYVTFGGRHAYLYANANRSWSKEEKKKKVTELRKQYKQELPRYEVNVQVLNG